MYKLCEGVAEGVISQMRSSLSSDLKDLQNHQENADARTWFYRGLKP